MKKTITVFLLFLFLFPAFGIFAGASGISAKSYICVAGGTLDILASEDIYTHRGMASTTKIMTAVLAIESGRLGDTVTINEERIKAEGTSLGLHDGDKLSLYDLTAAMLLSSGNDAANAVALFLAGSFPAFAEKMNEKAGALHMENTHFVTPSGLDDENHYSCAWDMAVLADYALKDPIFRKMVSMRTFSFQTLDGRRISVSNHNKLLSYVDGCIGIKTGFTKKSGRCLVSAARRDGKTVIVVTLSAPDDWNDHRKLFSEAFDRLIPVYLPLDLPQEMTVVGGEADAVPCDVGSLAALYAFSEPSEVRAELYFSPFVYAPVNEGDVLGSVRFMRGERLLSEQPITAWGSVAAKGPEKKESLIEKIRNFIFRIKDKWNKQ